MTKKRLEYLDMAKGVGIIGIIAMHSTVIPVRIVYGISQMVTPLFFLLSGMLIVRTGEAEKGWRDVLKRKTRSLMLPFFGFGLLYILRDLLRFLFGRCGKAEVLGDCRDLVTLFGSSVLWFLSTLFFAEILFIFLRRKYSAARTYLICLLLTVVSHKINGFIVLRQLAASFSEALFMLALFIQSLLRSAYALPFLCFGSLLFERFRSFWEEEGEFSPGQFGCGIFLLGTGIFLNMRYVGLDFRGLDFGRNPILVYLFAPVPFVGLLLLLKNCRPVRAVTYFGKNSLVVMATHIGFYLLNAALKLTSRIGESMSGAAGITLYTAVVVGVVLLLETVCIAVIDRFFPFLAGKRKYFHSPKSLL